MSSLSMSRRWVMIMNRKGFCRNFWRDSRITRLERDIKQHPDDMQLQAAYIRELNQSNNPEEAIRYLRRNRNTFTADTMPEPVFKEYISALVKSGKWDRTKLKDIMPLSSAATSPNMRYVEHATEPAPETMTYFNNSHPKKSLHHPFDHAKSSSSFQQQFFGDGSAGRNSGALSGLDPGSSSSFQKLGTQAEPIQVALAEPSMKAQIWKTVRALGLTFLFISGIGAIMEERGVGKSFGMISDVLPEPGQDDPKKFDDVKGCDEAKEELEEIVHYLRNPAKFTRLGGKLPKGVLLVGPPGTGKTLLARAIAGEAGVPFFYASGSEFEEMFVGVGARRVRELFTAAKRRAPCIIFIDEIDAIGGKRNPKDQQYMKMTLNQLLVELDGFNPTDGIIVVGATNFPESLDKALVRPGRFDRHVSVPNPDVEGRRQILQAHTKNITLHPDVDLSIIARGTPGFSGAELANLANMAALKAAIDGSDSVQMRHLEYAKDKILMGAERKSAVISEESKKLTAYHEGGHALVAINTDGSYPVHKATIVPRGMSLGMVSQLPDKDVTSMSRKQMLARLDVCMGGRVAEELIFGSEYVTSGAESDFKQATDLAEAMVTRFGMSKDLGTVSYDKKLESGETRAKIESEVRTIILESYNRAKKILEMKQDELHNLANALLEHETLTGEQVMLASKGKLPPLTLGENSKKTTPGQVNSTKGDLSPDTASAAINARNKADISK